MLQRGWDVTVVEDAPTDGSRARAAELGLELCPGVPSAWYGQGWEVHDLPTAAGKLSFAVRWHGERPALLWELDRYDDVPVPLTAPTLDPTWTTTEARGEALLAPVARA